jgi:hypothetical protein
VDLEGFFADGLEALRALNVHNDYNAHIIAPSFNAEPWYADHDSDAARRYEQFMTQDLVPWVQATYGVTGQEEHWLVGLSKSGFGAVTLLFRNPAVFSAAAAYDFPADQSDANDWNMLDNYGTDANFQANYRLTDDWIEARKGPFQTEPRLWLSQDSVTVLGSPTFMAEVSAFAGRLQSHQVQFLRTGGADRTHDWTSGWLGEAVAGLQGMRYTARDDFQRADGGLGPNWTRQALMGTGGVIAGNEVWSPFFTGGGFLWNAKGFGPNQFSQVTITGAIGDWAGVVVRGKASPEQGYWLAVKGDGAHLYALVDGVFHELVHDATGWSSGDTLRVEVRTVAPGTARLTVYRNGIVLFTHDDSGHFIAEGQPGLGLFASTTVSVDAWRGGELNGLELGATHATSAVDDFNRADGDLGSSWTRDPTWGGGGTISGNQVGSALSYGGAFFWSAHGFAANQYSQIRLTGTIGDWVGVAVRGKVSPAQGYWLAVKGDGAYLYALVDGVFHQLVHDPSAWSTGDVLRLQAETIAPGTARLTVYRNSQVVFTHDDASHFIASGQPGIGLYASTAVALDDWRGGEIEIARDDFNRPDGELGPDWERDPWWGPGGAVMGQRVAAAASSGGAFYWVGDPFGADQYSQARLTGEIGDWAGVVVRGKLSQRQGYWLAVKGDGVYLYSLLNGEFAQLVHHPTIWATGDTVRLEVRTVAAGTARLTILRNGSVLFTHDDATYFVGSGQPGLGLFANSPVALDDWEGGTLP